MRLHRCVHGRSRAGVLVLAAVAAASCARGGGGGGSGPDDAAEPPAETPDARTSRPADAATGRDLREASAAPDGPAPDDVDMSMPVDAGPVADAAPGDARPGDAAVRADGGPTPAPVGVRLSLEDAVTARWVGDRRTVTVENGTKIFTGAYRAGQFGGSGDGHIIRFRLDPGREYLFEYRFRFDPGFDFSRGGKIPGLGGGNAPSGCATSTGIGFSARSMWRQQGRLIGYIYDMDQSGDCGNAIETGFNFAVGRWYQIKQRIKLNTGSSRNGVLQLWVDERQVINRSNMGWMIEAPDRRIDRVFLDFFFGGSTADWAPSRNCSISFSDLYATKLTD